jgi:hypothetical protein
MNRPAIFAVVMLCISGCATTGGNMRSGPLPTQQYISGNPNNKGYKYSEARACGHSSSPLPPLAGEVRVRVVARLRGL